MARPLRIEFAGALYHVTARGNERKAIYRDDTDREIFLKTLHTACNRFNWHCHAYCLMDNHYHLLIETGDATLSRGMKYLNGTYTQHFNQHHHRVGHVLQGRFKAILIQKEDYLLEVARYVVLNPVRAHMINAASHWAWSSYRATAGLTRPHPCLTRDWILSHFGNTQGLAFQRYRAFIEQAKNGSSPWAHLKNQIYLGSDSFIEAVQTQINPEQPLEDIPRPQRLAPPKPLQYYLENFTCRKTAMARAYLDGHYTLQTIGNFFGVSHTTVSRALKASDVKC